MKKRTIYILVFLLMISYCNAEEVSIDNNTINLVAGSTYTINITISVEKPHTINLWGEVQPTDEGFTITFNPNNFTINKQSTITATINTSPLLTPDDYTINLCYNLETKDKSSGKSSSKTVYVETIDKPDNGNNDVTDKPPEEPIAEPDITDDTQQEEYQPDEQENGNPLLILIPILVAISVITIFEYIIYVHKKKEKKE